MKKTTLLLVILFAVTTAFKGGDKREAIKFDGASLSLLLINNEAIVLAADPRIVESAKHTWVQTNFDDDKKVILRSNQNVIDSSVCKSQVYWFLSGSALKTTGYNSCEDGKNIQVEVDSKYTYSVMDKDGTTYLFLFSEAGQIAHKYMVKSVEKVTYKKYDQTGYEITLVKQ